MVLAAKVFVVKEERNLPLVASKLKDFKLEQEVRIEGDTFSLLSEITDLDISKESLEGTFAFDTVFQVNQHGKIGPHSQDLSRHPSRSTSSGRACSSASSTRRAGRTTSPTR